MKKGFTLIEILLVLALVAIVSAISVPYLSSIQNRNDLDLAAEDTVQSIHRAEILAQAVDGDSQWGVNIQSGTITLYKGDSYASRDQSYDELFDLSGSITPSGLLDINFAKMTGLPLSTGTLVLTSNINETKNITINSKGLVTSS